MALYAILAGLGGGFGGETFHAIEEHETYDKAMNSAWGAACEDYESYAGSQGLPSMEDIAEEHGLDLDEDYEEISSAYAEEKESWLSYSAILITEDNVDKLSGYSVGNDNLELRLMEAAQKNKATLAQ